MSSLKTAPKFKLTHYPDADNLAKAVLDALVAIGCLQDDRLVWSLHVTKRYADATPGCVIRLLW